jgi:hypothetical protein
MEFSTQTKSEEVLKSGWGGALTHELVGKILCLAGEIGEPMYSTALKFIQGVPQEWDVQAFIEELEDLVNDEEEIG